MVFCRQCGAELQKRDRFCAQCGAGQQAEGRGEAEVLTESSPAGAELHHGSEKKDLRYMGVGIRFFAQLIDGIICLIFYAIIGSMIAAMVGGTTPDGFEVEGYPAIWIQLLTAVVSILYFSLLETFWNGQTLGKKVTRIQVVCEDGSTPDFFTSIIRNVMRIIDGFAFYLVAAICVWVSPKKQRLGDRVAGTFVIKKDPSPKITLKKRKKVKLTSRDDVYMSGLD